MPKRKKREVELKYFDTEQLWYLGGGPAIPYYIPGVQRGGYLNLIPQGTGSTERIGRSCIIKSIHITLSIGISPLVDTQGISEALSVWLVLDRQNNGAGATAADLFEPGQLSTVIGNKNMANDKRFVVIKKWKWSMGSDLWDTSTEAPAQDAKPHIIDWYKKCNIPLLFDAQNTGGGLETIRSNNLFLMKGGEESFFSWRCDGYCRLRFEDA